MNESNTQLSIQIQGLEDDLANALAAQDEASTALAKNPASAEARGKLQQAAGRVAGVRSEITLLESVRNHALKLDDKVKDAEQTAEAQRLLHTGARFMHERLKVAEEIDQTFERLKQHVDEWVRLTTEAKISFMAAKRLRSVKPRDAEMVLASTIKCMNNRFVSQIDWATKSLEISKHQLSVEYHRDNPYGPDLVIEDVRLDNHRALREIQSVTGLSIKPGSTA